MKRDRVTSANGTLLIRAALSRPAPLRAIAALAMMLALLGVLTPTLLGGLLTAGLRYDASQATPLQRDLTASFLGAPISDDDGDPWDGLHGDLAATRLEMPPELSAASDPAQFVTRSGNLDIEPFEGRILGSAIALAAGPDFFEQVQFVTGRAPAAAVAATRRENGALDPTDAAGQEQSLGPIASGVLDMAVSVPTAHALHWTTGATHRVTLPDGGHQAVRLTGTFQARDRADGYWGHVFQTLRPGVIPSASGPGTPVGTAWMAPASLPVLGALTGAGDSSVQTSAWYGLRLKSLTNANAAPLSAASRHFTAARHAAPHAGDTPLSFSSQLSGVIGSSQSRNLTSRSLITASLTGPLGGAVAILFLIARLTIIQSRHTLELLSARGAAPWALRGVVGGIVAAVALTASFVGGGLGLVSAEAAARTLDLPPITSQVFVFAAPLFCGLLPAIVVCALVPSLMSRPVRYPVRPLVEAFLFVLTAVSVVLVLRRGLASASGANGVDPLTAAVPLLLVLSGCVVAVRLLPRALELLRRRAQGRRGVSFWTGIAYAKRSAAASGLPLAAATIGIAVMVFAVVLGATLSDGLFEASRASVGADVAAATSATELTKELPFAKIAGVSRVAFVSDSSSVDVHQGASTLSVAAIVGRASAIQQVQVGVPGALPLPSRVAAKSDKAIPVIVSSALARRLGSHALESNGIPLLVLGVGPEHTSLVPNVRLWLFVDEENASRLSVDNDAPDMTLLRLHPGASSRVVVSHVRRLIGSTGAITTPAQTRATLSRNPLVPGLNAISRGAAAFGALFGLLALIIATFLDTRSRRARIGLLALLGIDSRQRRFLVFTETFPLGGTAVLLGLILGTVMAVLVLPSADLRSFTGSMSRPPIRLNIPGLGLVGTVGLLAASLVSLLAARLASTRPLNRASLEDQE